MKLVPASPSTDGLRVFALDRPRAFVEGLWADLSPAEIEGLKARFPEDWRLGWLRTRPVKHRLAVTAIVRQEERYLAEWIEHHLALGVGAIYLYDNNDEPGLEGFLRGVLPPELASCVEIVPWHEPREFPQYDALYDCVRKHAADVEWLLPIDADEFLWLDGISLSEFLGGCSDASQVYLSWECFNASGQLRYEPRPVMERFTETYVSRDGGQGKSMFRPTRLRRWGVHAAELATGLTVDAVGRPCRPPAPDLRLFKRAWVKHYFTKSLEEWLWKIERGCCDPVYLRRYAEFFEANPGMRSHFNPSAPQVQGHRMPQAGPKASV